MDKPISLKAEKRTLCEILSTDSICNDSCKIHLYFSERMNFYAKGVFNLEAGPPREILLCYANSSHYNCALRFGEELDCKMSSYLEQTNPRVEVINQKPSHGIPFFDFTRSLRDMFVGEQTLLYDGSEVKKQSRTDPLSDPLRLYVNRRINERIQDSSLRFLVYANLEDQNLAQRVVLVINRELASRAMIKPPIVFKQGKAVEFPDSYVVDLEYILHQAIKQK